METKKNPVISAPASGDGKRKREVMVSIRIIMRDLDATDDDEEEEPSGHRRWVGEDLFDIRVEVFHAAKRRPSSASEAAEKEGERDGAGKSRPFLGVQRRPSGNFGAEIYDRTAKKKMWLGTFDTAEAAALAYDAAAVKLRGPKTNINFPNTAVSENPSDRF